MTDIFDKQTRSKIMSTVRSKNTKLEIEIRKRLFEQGFRYRLHADELPGKPDIVFPKYATVIFIHGCFWHFHGCTRSTIPEERREWWEKKLHDNRIRDAKDLAALHNAGWRILIVWECAVRGLGINREKALDNVGIRAGKFLRSKRKLLEISGPLLKTNLERQTR